MATLYMTDNAFHWYQSHKQSTGWHDWDKFVQDVLQEFNMNVHRDKLHELHQLKQTSSVAEYKHLFDQLVYHIELYDPAVGGLMLANQFTMGLKRSSSAMWKHRNH